VCVCEDEARVARAAGIRRRLVVVHNGCPACEAVEPALTLDGLVVGAVTVLRRQKRLDVLLAAAPRILDAGATVVIVGDGPEAARLRAAADPRVVFLPFSAPAARYLRGLDVYVLPSDWEAFPIGLLEAQACGVPQVATDVGGTREALTPETGLLVPPGDPGALADAVIALLRDPQRRAAMAAASRARHAERFTVERMVAETVAVYAGVLGSGSSASSAAGTSRVSQSA
jgi:glycosyltransferase involved in cell wall biosynthesis